MADKLGDKTEDKPSEADTAPQPKTGRQSQMGDKLGDKTGQAQRGGHSTPAKVKGKARRGTNAETKLGHMGDKLGDKTADKPSEADAAPQPR